MVQAGEVVLKGGRVMVRLLKVKVFTTITSLSFHQHDKHANSLAREGASAQSGPIPYAGHMSIIIRFSLSHPSTILLQQIPDITLPYVISCQSRILKATSLGQRL